MGFMNNNFVEIIGFDDKLIGHKNINCPDYEHCLQNNCILNSRYWICNGCKQEHSFKKVIDMKSNEIFISMAEQIN